MWVSAGEDVSRFVAGSIAASRRGACGIGVARQGRSAFWCGAVWTACGGLAGVLLCVGFQRQHRQLEHRVGDDAVLGMRPFGRRAHGAAQPKCGGGSGPAQAVAARVFSSGYICISIYLYLYLCIYLYLYIYIYIFMHLYPYLYLDIYLHMNMCACVCVCACACVCVCVCVCVCACV